MKILKLIALAALLVGSIFNLAAAEKGDLLPDTWWRITSGKGVGYSLKGFGTLINDSDYEAVGHVGSGEECDCRHYHGTLFGEPDPNPTGCGWGCVEEMEFASKDALGDLLNEAALFGILNPMLGAKLTDLIHAMDHAATNDCYSAVEALADAIEDEIYAYLGDDGDETAFDPLFRALNEYANLSEYEMPLSYVNMPLIKPNTARLLYRIGSGNSSRLLDVGAKVNISIGSLVSLEGYGPDVDLYKWEYKFKGAALGELPSGCYASFVGNHFTASSLKSTQLRVTMSGRGPDNRYFKDMTVINFNKSNF